MTMSTYTLGADLGTTSIKVVLLENTSRTVAASHTLPTASDIFDSSDIKVSPLMIETTYSCTCAQSSGYFSAPGERAAHRPDHRHSEQMHEPAAQGHDEAC